MEGKASSMQDAATQTVQNEAAPPSPSGSLAAARVPQHAPVNRKLRRINWQADKIHRSRQEKLQKKAQKREGGSLTSNSAMLRLAPQSTPYAAYTDTTGGECSPWEERTKHQQKTIREFKLCAKYLEPEHRPSDPKAPCTGQPLKPFSTEIDDYIRGGGAHTPVPNPSALHNYNPGGGVEGTPEQSGGLRPPEGPTASQPRRQLAVPQTDFGIGRHGRACSVPQHGPRPIPQYHFTNFLTHHGSFLSPNAGQHSASKSRHPEWGQHRQQSHHRDAYVAEQTASVSTRLSAMPRARGNAHQNVQNEALLGMERSTSSSIAIPEFFIEDFDAPLEQPVSVMPDSTSSERAPRLPPGGLDWETETRVTDNQHQTKDDSASRFAHDDLAFFQERCLLLQKFRAAEMTLVSDLLRSQSWPKLCRPASPSWSDYSDTIVVEPEEDLSMVSGVNGQHADKIIKNVEWFIS